MGKTKIEWSDDVWNPVTGCTKVSEGCRNCYAMTFAERWRGIEGHYFEKGFDVQLRPHKMDDPLFWKKPRKVFVNSMSDLFHEKVPFHYIEQVYGTMALANKHTFQVLTKRPDRMQKFYNTCVFNGPLPGNEPLDNVWIGVSVEDNRVKNRIDILREIPAQIRFISFEPLIGDVGKLNLDGVHWAIIGGESGHGARKMNTEWATNIKNQCLEQGVSVFIKQMGSVWAKDNESTDSKGGNWDDWADEMKHRGFPDELNTEQPVLF